ncbi:MAG: imidazole glycerol phosphate synthase subunit HisH [Bacteroidales bacterium]|nr:imidazole glycerol phosphate synthase subunit HisH [Bacteroidales bacterium]
MIAIVDYDAGNIKSVGNALSRLGAEYVLTDSAAEIEAADKVILPGVGNAAEAVASLRAKCLDKFVRSLRKPVLGICAGMQIMCRHSEEGDASCLGIFDCNVLRFNVSNDAKVPHMGWNAISNLDSGLFKGMKGGCCMYFVHSYYPQLCCDTIATCRHGGTIFSAALRYENFYGTQFHPEKSGEAGEMILRNFLAL